MASDKIPSLSSTTLPLLFVMVTAVLPAPLANGAEVDSTFKDLGGTASTVQNRNNVPIKPVSRDVQKRNAETAKAVNKIAGVKLQASDLQPPADDLPITGFHPVKKAIAPVVRLEKNSVQLQQQIMKLEGPISALQPAMLGLHSKMDGVDKRMVGMQAVLGKMDSGVSGVSEQMNGVRADIAGVRSDLSGMRKRIDRLEVPIRQLQQPLQKLQEPLSSVAAPLNAVHKELLEMKALLASVLFAILVAAVAIAIGTPIATVLIYKNRRKLFPDMRDHDFPGAKAAEPDKMSARV
jgi:hypothetical protein